jgi:hypothetical protein
MNQFSLEDKLIYNPIPFAEYISRSPIKTFVISSNSVNSPQNYSIDIDTTKITETQSKSKSIIMASEIKYSFMKEELSMPVIHFHKYIKDNKFTDEQILAYKIARRRYNNCIYSCNARLKRKMKKTSNNNTNSNISNNCDSIIEDDAIFEHEIIEKLHDLPDLIHYTYI